MSSPVVADREGEGERERKGGRERERESQMKKRFKNFLPVSIMT
jgi:hypothetical protein